MGSSAAGGLDNHQQKESENPGNGCTQLPARFSAADVTHGLWVGGDRCGNQSHFGQISIKEIGEFGYHTAVGPSRSGGLGSIAKDTGEQCLRGAEGSARGRQDDRHTPIPAEGTLARWPKNHDVGTPPTGSPGGGHAHV